MKKMFERMVGLQHFGSGWFFKMRALLAPVLFLGMAAVSEGHTLTYNISHPDGARLDGNGVRRTGDSVILTVADGEDGTPVGAWPYWDHRFVQWSDGRTDNPRIDTNVTSNITVTAEFEEFNPRWDENVTPVAEFSEDYAFWELDAEFLSLDMVTNAAGDWVLKASGVSDYNGSITFPVPTRNISTKGGYSLEIHNTSTNKLVFDLKSIKAGDFEENRLEVWPGETEVLYTQLGGKLQRPYSEEYNEFFGGINGHYWGLNEVNTLDQGEELWNLPLGAKVELRCSKVMNDDLSDAHDTDYSFNVNWIRVAGTYSPVTSDDLANKYTPFLDEFFQPIHKEFETKVHSWGQFFEMHEEQAADVAAHPYPEEQNEWGGWTNAPAWLMADIANTNYSPYGVSGATGRYRTHKDRNGKWWFVDPAGYPFVAVGAVGSPGFSFRGADDVRSAATDHLFKDPIRTGSLKWRMDVALENGEQYPPDFTVADEVVFRRNSANRSVRRARSYGFTYNLVDWKDLGPYRPDTGYGGWDPKNDPLAEKMPYVYKDGGKFDPVPADLTYAEARAKMEPFFLQDDYQYIKDDPWCIGVCLGIEIATESGDTNGIVNYAKAWDDLMKQYCPGLLNAGQRLRTKEHAAVAPYSDVVANTSFGGFDPAIKSSFYNTEKPGFQAAYTMQGQSGFSGGGKLTTFKQRARHWTHFYKMLFEHDQGVAANFYTMNGISWLNRVNHDSGIYNHWTKIPYKEITDNFREMGKMKFYWRTASTNVPPFNAKPMFSDTYYKLVDPDSAFSVTVGAGDKEGDTLTFALVDDGGASFASFDAGTQTLSGTPTLDDVGIYFVTLSVTDGQGAHTPVTTKVAIEVLPTVTVTYLASTGGSISGGSAVQTLKQGENTVEVEAKASAGYVFAGWDDGRSAALRTEENVLVDATYTANFVKVVPELNADPMNLSPAAPGIPYHYSLLNAAPDEGADWSYSILSGPSWLGLDGDGHSLTGTPVGVGSYSWEVEISTAYNTTTGTINIAVVDVLWSEDFEASPTLVPDDDNFAYVDGEYTTDTFVIGNTNIQYLVTTNGTTSFRHGQNARSAAVFYSIDESHMTGAGWYRYHYNVIDYNKYSKARLPGTEAQLRVRILDASAGGDATPANSYWIDLEASNKGLNTTALGANGTATVELLSSALHVPYYITGTDVVGTPYRGRQVLDFYYDGTGDVLIVMQTQMGDSSEQQFVMYDDLMVTPYSPNAPSFESPTIVGNTAVWNEDYADTVSGSVIDSDAGETLTYSILSGPSWLTMAADGTLSGLPVSFNSTLGTNTWSIQVEDHYGYTATSTLKIPVVEVFNTAPVVLQGDPISKNALTGVAFSDALGVDVFDADGDLLTYTVTGTNGATAWLTVNPDGTLSGTPAAGDVGTSTWDLQIDDGNGGVVATTLRILVQEPIQVVWEDDFSTSSKVDGNNVTFPGAAALSTSTTEGNWAGRSEIKIDGDERLELDTDRFAVAVALDDSLFTATGAGDYRVDFDIVYVGGSGGSKDINIYEFDSATSGTITYDCSYSDNGTVTGGTATQLERTALTNAVGSYSQDFTYTAGMDILLGFSTPSAGGIAYIDNIRVGLKGVAPTNAVPSYSAAPVDGGTISAESFYSSDILPYGGVVTDADGDELFHSILSGPEWLNMAPNGFVSGTPATADVGTNSWNIFTRDGKGGSTNATLQIVVEPRANHACYFASDPMKLPAVGAVKDATGKISPFDADGDLLHVTKLTGPAWLNIGWDGTLSGTPGIGDIGDHSGTVKVEDGYGGVDTAVFNISVINNAPEFTANPTSLPDATAGMNYTNNLANYASDIEGDAMLFLFSTNNTGPAWLNLASDGTLSGTPLPSDAYLNSWTVWVTDSVGSETNEAVITLYVDVPGLVWSEEFNSDPIPDSTYGTFVIPTENDRDKWLIQQDLKGWRGEYVEIEEARRGVAIAISSGHFTQTGTYTLWFNTEALNVGTNDVLSVNVFGADASSGGSYELDVRANGCGSASANAPATITSLAATSTSAGNYGVTGFSVDFEYTTPGQDIALIIWRPSYTSGSIYLHDLFIQVMNAVPVFATDPINEANAMVGIAYSGSVANATDADGDTLTYSKVSGPDWLNVATNGVLSGTPVSGDVGTNSWIVQVDDGKGGTDTATLEIVVQGTSSGLVWSEDFATNSISSRMDADNTHWAPMWPTDADIGKWCPINANQVDWEFGNLEIRTKNGTTRACGISLPESMFMAYGPGTYTLTFNVVDVQNGILLGVGVYDAPAGGTYSSDYSVGSPESINWIPGISPGTMLATNLYRPSDIGSTVTNTFVYDGSGDVVITFNSALAWASTTIDKGCTLDDIALVKEVGVTTSPYDTWAGDYGLSGTNAAPVVDYDLDGRNNLLEYALNGNPTNPAQAGSSPVLGIMLPEGGTNWIEYIHLERTTPGHGLTYTIEQTPDLVDTPWSNSTDAVVAGEGTLNSDFKTVTNKVPMAGKTTEFLRLRVDHE